MVLIVLIVLLLAVATSLKSFLSDTRENISEVLGEVVLASRMPLDSLSVEEMRSQNIYPYFCYQEYKMVWVESPSDKENCPWCNSHLIPCS